MFINNHNIILAKQVLSEIYKYNNLARKKKKPHLNINQLKKEVGLSENDWDAVKVGNSKISNDTYQHILGLIKQKHYNLAQRQVSHPNYPNSFKNTKKLQLKRFIQEHQKFIQQNRRNRKSKKTKTKMNQKMLQFLKNNRKPSQPQHTHYVITKIQVQKHHRNRFNVFVNHHYSFPISVSAWSKYRLARGMYITPKFKEKLIRADEISQAYDIALKYVVRQLRSKDEVINKLKRRHIDDKSIKVVVKKLKYYHLLNDKHYASAYVRTQVRDKKRGPFKIRQYLRRKGIPKDYINYALKNYYSTNDVLANGVRQAKIYFKGHQGNSYNKTIRKVKASLMRKGYSFDQIGQIIQKAHLHPNHTIQHRELMRRTKIAFNKYKRYRNKNHYQMKLKIQQYLYRQGFSFDEINKAISKYRQSNFY